MFVDGIHVESFGTGSPPFLLIHGWCSDLTAMRPLARLLARRHRVVCLDLRGHGRSEMREPLSMTSFADDVRTVARSTGLTHPIVVGHSMGGRVALALASRHPGFAREIVLLDSAIDDRPRFPERRRELESLPWAATLRKRSANIFVNPTGRIERAVTERIVATQRAPGLASFVAAETFDAAGALRACRTPLLYIGGSRPREERMRIAELAPAAVYGQVIGTRHFIQVDSPDQVHAMIERFLVLRRQRRV